MDNKIVNLELKMINVEKTVQMVEQDTRVSQAVREALVGFDNKYFRTNRWKLR